VHHGGARAYRRGGPAPPVAPDKDAGDAEAEEAAAPAPASAAATAVPHWRDLPPGLAVAGNFLDGVGVPACLVAAGRAASAVLAAIG
jgi:hypothetical protein